MRCGFVSVRCVIVCVRVWVDEWASVRVGEWGQGGSGQSHETGDGIYG